MKIFRNGKEIKTEALFLGECKGIALTRRGKDDPHVCMSILTEDDEQWFESSNPSSSYWMKDLQEQLNNAIEWIEKNCDKDPDGFGYVFK